MCVSSLPPESTILSPSFPDDYFYADELADDMIYIKVLGASGVPSFAGGRRCLHSNVSVVCFSRRPSTLYGGDGGRLAELGGSMGEPVEFHGASHLSGHDCAAYRIRRVLLFSSPTHFPNYLQNRAWCKHSFPGVYVWE